MPLEDEVAKQLLDWIVGVNVSQKHLRKGEAIARHPSEGWTVGFVLGAVGELAEAIGKTPEVIIANTIQQVTEERDGKREKLKTAWHYIEHDSLPCLQGDDSMELVAPGTLKRLERSNYVRKQTLYTNNNNQDSPGHTTCLFGDYSDSCAHQGVIPVVEVRRWVRIPKEEALEALGKFKIPAVNTSKPSLEGTFS
jgi:hypothetical protein